MTPTKKLFYLNLGFVIIICLVCVFAKVRATGSDPMGTLLVSQAIVQSGTIKLDAYEKVFQNYTYKIRPKNEHYYYYFPLGTSVFAVPAVALANALGFDMVAYEVQAQAVIALLISLANYFLLVQIAKLYMSPAKSSFVAIVFWLGTAYASTGSTALWSHDLAVFFSTAAIYLLLRIKFRLDTGSSILMGFCLFAAYFCRPTLSLLVPVYLVALGAVSWRLAIRVALTVAIFLAGFVAFSIHEFHQVLPGYYLPQRLAGDKFSTALYGNLLSPARGLLIYSPFLVLPMVWGICSRLVWSRFSTEGILLAWPVIHLIVISRFPHWWAGWSFGSRLMMDVLPGLFVLLVCYLSELPLRFSLRWGSFIGLGLLGVWINAYQGLFNRNTENWNAEPNIDYFPEYLFDWKCPQFLSTSRCLKQRLIDHEAKNLVDLTPIMAADLSALAVIKLRDADMFDAQLRESPVTDMQYYDFLSNNLYFLGWYPPESLFRWSAGHHAEILFYLAPGANPPSSIAITASALQKQRFRLLLNEHALGDFNVDIQEQVLTIKVDPNYFLPGAINALHFDLPGASRPPNGDPRVLALALRKIRFNE